MTPEEYAAQLDSWTRDGVIEQILSRVPDTVDKREGSIIYDAVAPAAVTIVDLVTQFKQFVLESYTQTADNEFLDYRGQEKGLTRYAATNAVVTAVFTDVAGQPIGVDNGDRFATIETQPYYYTVSQVLDGGKAQLTCETAGEGPNHYLGQILPVTPNDDVANAVITDITVPARDTETDDDYRARILKQSTSVAYGGNIADYQAMIAGLETVGAVQVYPTWNGGGTVKLVILDNDYDIPSDDLVTQVQQAIDPQDATGNGYGLAPIGHTVTVVAPTARTINMSLSIEIDKTTDYTTAANAAKQAIADYIVTVHKAWANLDNGTRSYAQSVYRSQVFAAVLKVPGVINVTGLTLEGKDADVQLVLTGQETQLAELGEVTINDAAATA
ncbi:baseplate J/gp47 family protein [Lacticaseibacillus hulanensis]|uniref:baseplate J/gp47 family protein n=1 Tax=Lacticaseibacillus hulanensis TaxID=2493111 RepID=UPI000FD9E428|nr:baseplate J/gp47 family protein [Lacticaseibacillus hulanensis]